MNCKFGIFLCKHLFFAIHFHAIALKYERNIFVFIFIYRMQNRSQSTFEHIILQRSVENDLICIRARIVKGCSNFSTYKKNYHYMLVHFQRNEQFATRISIRMALLSCSITFDIRQIFKRPLLTILIHTNQHYDLFQYGTKR